MKRNRDVVKHVASHKSKQQNKDTKFIAIPDCHIPLQDKVAFDVARQITQWYNPDQLIILGDFLDCTPVSHWIRNKRKKLENLRLKDDYETGNQALNSLVGSALKRLVYLEGNHCDWLRQLIDEQPELEGLIDLHIGMKFEERRKKYEVLQFKYGQCYALGKLNFTHGLYTCMHHAKKHVESFGRSIVYGHLHDVQLYTKVSPIDVDDKHLGLSLGCLADKNPEFMRNRPNNWVHALGIGLVREDGTFNIDPVIISNGKATYAGKTFTSKV